VTFSSPVTQNSFRFRFRHCSLYRVVNVTIVSRLAADCKWVMWLDAIEATGLSYVACLEAVRDSFQIPRQLHAYAMMDERAFFWRRAIRSSIADETRCSIIRTSRLGLMIMSRSLGIWRLQRDKLIQDLLITACIVLIEYKLLASNVQVCCFISIYPDLFGKPFFKFFHCDSL
jgi:hypothetical protein